ncbi:MAG: uracil-DNA glycosylase, partial [bacterium]
MPEDSTESRKGLLRFARNDSLERLSADIIACSKCPRLRTYCRKVARDKKREFRAATYWGKPVPGFGDPAARVLIIGLAPAAHGANRTGRIFTGDSSGNWLYRALFKAGFASQPNSISRDDGLRLDGAYISATCRCAPPGNRPSSNEIANCRPYLEREIEWLHNLKVVVCLGRIAFDNYLRILKSRGIATRGCEFGHGRIFFSPSPAPPPPIRQSLRAGS